MRGDIRGVIGSLAPSSVFLGSLSTGSGRSGQLAWGYSWHNRQFDSILGFSGQLEHGEWEEWAICVEIFVA